MRKKLVLNLTGGLGNQMFQYAAAKALALGNDSDLVIDNVTGFKFDFRYKRQYGLNDFKIHARESNFLERIPFLILKGKRALNFKQVESIREKNFGLMVEEPTMGFDSNVRNLRTNKNIWMTGYWQDPKYFREIQMQIRNDFEWKHAINPKILELGNLMTDKDSLALSIRFYEETSDPAFHSHNRKVKPLATIASQVEEALRSIPQLKIFVFSTKDSKDFSELNLPNGTVFITPDRFRLNASDKLWLISRCRHHIFNNSTFYWWGAWLSESYYAHYDQLIVGSDNFTNPSILEPHWTSF